MKKKILKSNAQTYFIRGRGIPKGCQLCLKGEKTVLFLNGICQNPAHCYWYCPISTERKGKEFSFANEIKIKTNKELLDEINKTKAKGMSITGGEPLSEINFQKTIDLIKYVKEKKGNKFHIHLYTNGISFSEEKANKLAQVGLDELRFNPPEEKWNLISFALNIGIKVGAEVPMIPNEEYVMQLKKFILYLDKIGAHFININEFEFSFPNSKYLIERGFKLKRGSIAAVENSKEIALTLLKEIYPKVSLKIHFCTTRAKDYWQLKERYLRRAKSIRKPFEEITEDGLLVYAQIEGSKNNLNKLNELLLNKIKMPQKYIFYDEQKIRIPITFALEEKFIDLLDNYKLQGFIVEITPFREEQYTQITEKTPIKVFKEEIECDGNK
ncbi:MAG: 4Fe-4S cluster-binding domain-containing protein [Candidatus Heimdallarchaeota archaeon]